MIALLKRDLTLAFRSGGGFGQALIFFLILVILVPFGVGADGETLSLIAPGILWIGALLASLLSLDRFFSNDLEDGSLEILATSPLPMEACVLAKSLAHWLTTGLILALFSVVLGLLLNLDAAAYWPLFASLLIGTPALSLIGAFGAALTVGIRRGGLLLSILVLPLYIPTLIFGASVVVRAAQGLAYTTPLVLLAAITLGCVALLPFASAAAIRANLR